MIPALWVALVLGVVEGLTEFLPVSSTGHLILAGHALGFTGPKAEVFEVFIQAGAMVAVLGLYRARFSALLRPAAPGAFGGARGVALLALTTAPILVAGYLLRHGIREVLFAPKWVAVALAVGALALLAVERVRRGRGGASLDAGVGPRTALAIGLFQCLALWPGFSRAGATIAGGMLCGLSRSAAAEWSFLAAVPVIVIASAHEAWEARDSIGGEDALFLGVGFVVSAVAAAVAIRAFTAILSRTTLVPFAVYRLALAAAVALALA